MAGISDEDIQKVRDASDVVSVIGERVPVKQKGRDFWCCCPLHQEKTPSFKIDPSTQLWHCFGCGEGGDVFSFIMKTEDLTFPEAVRRLAERAHIDIVEEGGRGIPASQKARLKEICARTAEFYHTQLMRGRGAEADAARSYLAGRGFGGEVPKRWSLGFAPGRGALVRHLSQFGFSTADMIAANVALDGRGGPVRDRFYNRVMFPIFDVSGDCIAFGGRVIGTGEPKYLNSQETPLFHKSQVLYGLDHAKAAMASTGVAIVVEGYTDVIALSEAGIKNVVATLGTALTMRHIRVLSRHASARIVYLFDGDAAGQRAADRALAFIDKSMTPEAGRSQVELVAVTLPDNLDPAEFVAARGADALRELVEGAKPLLEYGIERRLASHNLDAAEGRARALEACLEVLAPIKESILAKDYAVRLAGRLRLRENDVLEALAAKEPPRFQNRDDEPAAPGPSAPAAPVRALSRAERNRLRFEREFLSLVAQHPTVGLAHADGLAQVQWHEEVHRVLAESILATLAENPAASAADIVTCAAVASPHAARVLTGGGALPASPEATGAYLAEELAIGDAEEAAGALKAQLAAGVSPDEAELLHAAVTALQMDVAARRAAHRALPQE
ncbi:DNA primase [Eggerthellaceae bacterium 24-137]